MITRTFVKNVVEEHSTLKVYGVEVKEFGYGIVVAEQEPEIGQVIHVQTINHGLWYRPFPVCAKVVKIHSVRPLKEEFREEYCSETSKLVRRDHIKDFY